MTPRAWTALVCASFTALAACGPLVENPPDVFDAARRDVPRDILPSDVPSDIPLDIQSDVRSDIATDTPSDVPMPMTEAQCHAKLTALGLTWRVAGASRGVEWPVTVTPPINGVTFRPYSLTATPNTSLFMDCSLAIALDALTRRLVSQHRVTDIAHMGIYNYRCIAGTDPCRLSNHSFARAIDLAAFKDSSGATYSVLNDFVANGRPTCPIRASGAKDQVLKEIACWMYDSRTFNVVLTPNYNADHRDHFHVDLTPGSHFIGASAPRGIDPDPSDPYAFWLDDI